MSSVPRRVLNRLQEQKEYDMAKQIMYSELSMQLLNTRQNMNTKSTKGVW